MALLKTDDRTGSGQRLYAIQGLQRKPADRIRHMSDNMTSNKAYIHAREAAGGDAAGELLATYVERFRWYRQGWRGNPLPLNHERHIVHNRSRDLPS